MATKRHEVSADVLARFQGMEGRIAELERRLEALTPSACSNQHDQPIISEPRPDSGITHDPTDPFVPPDWVYNEEKRWFTYLHEPEVCPVCGIGFFPPKQIQRSFGRLGFKKVKFKDTIYDPLVVKKGAYRCYVHKGWAPVDCFSAFQQQLPNDLFNEHHRMTQRLYNKIVEWLERPREYGTIVNIARECGVSRKTVSRIDSERRATAKKATNPKP